MKTAGLVLDFYDDFSGETLKSVCPTPEDLPESVKVAHILSPEERQVLRDDAFALILHNDGKQLRKFACVDEGNTVLSTLYFMENCHKLPEPAIKVAAANLAAFNESFGLPVPYQLQLAAETGMVTKIAVSTTLTTPKGKPSMLAKALDKASITRAMEWGGNMMEKGVKKFKPGMGKVNPAFAAGATAENHAMNSALGKSAAVSGMARKRNSDMTPATVGDEADWAARTNLLSVRGGSDAGRVIPAANQMKTAGVPQGMIDTFNRQMPNLSDAKAAYVQKRISAHDSGRLAGAATTTTDAIKRGLGGVQRRAASRTALRAAATNTPLKNVFSSVSEEKIAGSLKDPRARYLKDLAKHRDVFGGRPADWEGDKAFSAIWNRRNKVPKTPGPARGSEWVGIARRGAGFGEYEGEEVQRRFPKKVRGAKPEKKKQWWTKKEVNDRGVTVLSSVDANQKIAGVVDVSGLEAAPVVLEKQASKTALNGMYALDSYTDVQEAVQYFTDSWTEMKPEDRREFSVKTASRADELGIEVPELMQHYGSPAYGPDVEAHLANRRAIAPEFSTVWNELQEKRASIEPEVFASLLKEADEQCGLQYEYGGAVFDPYYATFGGQIEKVAWAYEDEEGNKLTEDALKSIPREDIEKNFTSDFAEAFSHAPTTIFDSMPADTKQVLARMVKTSASLGDQGSQSARSKLHRLAKAVGDAGKGTEARLTPAIRQQTSQAATSGKIGLPVPSPIRPNQYN